MAVWLAGCDAETADCFWLYVSGNHYQLVGPMQQLTLMEPQTHEGEEQEFILVPHGMRSHKSMRTDCRKQSSVIMMVQICFMQTMSQS